MQVKLESKRRHFSPSKTGTAMAVPAVPLPPALVFSNACRQEKNEETKLSQNNHSSFPISHPQPYNELHYFVHYAYVYLLLILYLIFEDMF